MGIVEIRDIQTGRNFVDWYAEGANMALVADGIGRVREMFSAVAGERVPYRELSEIPKLEDLREMRIANEDIELAAASLLRERGRRR